MDEALKRKLELAAKAAGISGDYMNPWGDPYLAVSPMFKPNGVWAPLDDDADSQRLLIAMTQHGSVKIEMTNRVILARVGGLFARQHVKDHECAGAALRYAVLDVAAQVGEMMEVGE